MFHWLIEQVRRCVPSIVVAVLTAAIVTPIAVSFAEDGAPPVESRASLPLSNTFTYQARVEADGVPLDGIYDIELYLFDDATPDAFDVLVGFQAFEDVAVDGGLVALEVNAGTAFDGGNRWVELGFRDGASTGDYTYIGARTKVTATPYALYALKGGPHLGETWTGNQDRSGFPPTAIFQVTNTNASSGAGDLAGLAIRGQAGAGGVGLYGLVQQSGLMPGVDSNSLTAGVIGQDLTQDCETVCVGVKGFAQNAIGNGMTVGVFANAGTYGVLSFGSNAGVKATASNGYGVLADGSAGGVFGSSAGGTGVYGTTNTGYGVSGYTNGSYSGVIGTAAGSNGTGVTGQSAAGASSGIGVEGWANQAPPVRPVDTGVYGYAMAADATGVYGRADGLNAVGIKGVAASSQEFAGYFQGKVTVTGTLTFPSDASLKHDVSALAYGLDEVLALQPSSYIYNDDDADALRFGLIAQDVRPVMPELVSEDPVTGMLSLNYIDVIPVLVRAIQEQDAEIASLRGTDMAADQAGGDSWALSGAIVLVAAAMLVLAGALTLRGGRRQEK